MAEPAPPAPPAPAGGGDGRAHGIAPADGTAAAPVIRVVQSNPMLTLTLIAALVALLLGAWLGYKWGARKLEATRAELAAIKKTEAANKTQYEATLQQIKAQGAEIESRHQQNVQKIEASYADERRQLQASLGQVETRLQQARDRASTTAGELADVRRRIASSTGSERRQLQLKEAELVQAQGRQEQAVKAVDCLRAQVPTEELTILSRAGAM